MQARIQIKIRGKEGWHPVELAKLKGPCLRDALAALSGEAAVAEIDIDGKKFYCCGTDDLRTLMAARGRAMLNPGAGQVLDLINPGILDTPLQVDVVVEVFEGAQLEEVAIDLPDTMERQADLFKGECRGSTEEESSEQESAVHTDGGAHTGNQGKRRPQNRG